MAEIAVKLAISKGVQLLESIAGKVYAGISEEVSLLAGVSKEIQYIIDELGILSAFLRDAEKKQMDNEAAKAWVEQVKHLSYDVEDCIENYFLHFDRHRSFCLLRPGSLGARHRIVVQIQSIKSRVEEVSSRRIRYGITSSAGRADDVYASVVSQHDPRLSALFVENSQLVGVDGPREKLVGWLLDQTEQEPSLIAVVGEGGIGKTTIVKKAYESPKVTGGHFECRAWIAVSQTYDVAIILRDLSKQLNVPADPKENLMGREKLTEKIRGYLEDKRYIVVFDDLWTIDAWKSLELALPKNRLGSRMLLTTRNQELAEVASATQTHHYVYRHQKLSPEQSMDLFLRRVFGNNSTSCSEELKKLTEAILDKCDGLPLAIVSIAGVLASKPNKSSREEWEKLMRRLGSELELNPSLAGMKHILTLSYNDLPYHVRHCFLYLCKFPEDYLIERKGIQRLWVAEGFIFSRPDMSTEEVAESYFNELANRFMILPASFSRVSGKVKSFRVHDIMLELVVQKSREENFAFLIKEKSGWPSQHLIRRLSVQYMDDELEQNATSPSHVRSLTMYGDGLMPKLISPSVGLLRVLDLESCRSLRDSHLLVISELIHLRYLSLRQTHVENLPNRLGNLKKLETLDIRNTSISKLPKRITELHKLRHLLHKRYWSLKIPIGIGRLRALQMLAINVEESSKKVIKELGKMTQLRKLKVEDLKPNQVKDFANSLNTISSSLRSLSFKNVPPKDLLSSYHLKNLSRPPFQLESLKLAGVRITKIPSWFFSLNNLLKLEIKNYEVEEGVIQRLGTLPNLIRLKLKHQRSKGHDLFGARRFLRLKDLHVHYSSHEKSVSFQEGTMPHLESICFKAKYKSFSGITISGITSLPSLKELRTNDVKVKEALEQQLVQHPNHPTLYHIL